MGAPGDDPVLGRGRGGDKSAYICKSIFWKARGTRRICTVSIDTHLVVLHYTLHLFSLKRRRKQGERAPSQGDQGLRGEGGGGRGGGSTPGIDKFSGHAWPMH